MTGMLLLALFVGYTIVLAGVVHAQSLSDVERLLTYIFDEQKYNTKVRGRFDQTRPVPVNVSLTLVSIEELDDIRQTLKTLSALHVSWTDDRLAWDEDMYNGTSEFTVSQAAIWRPELVLANPAEHVHFLGSDRTLARVASSGRVEWTAADVFTSTCYIDVTYYPYDRQSCDISFIVSGSTTREVILGSSSHLYRQRLIENGEWDLLDSSVRFEDEDLMKVHFSITLKRRASFVIVLQLAPVMLMGASNTLVFFIPTQSGERLSYSMTITLSLAVFFTLVGESMPSNADTMAIMCYFLLFNIGLSSLTCSCAIVSMKLYFKDDQGQPVPPWLAGLASRCCCGRCRRVTVGGNKVKQAGEHDAERKDDVLTDGDNNGGHNTLTWRNVSQSFDRFCFATLFITFNVGALLFFNTVFANS